MNRDRLTRLAMELLKVGVSRPGVERLLGTQELDEIERQLAYLPFRHAKRPEAFIVEAVRNHYSAPKEFYYAASQDQPTNPNDAVDQGSELPD